MVIWRWFYHRPTIPNRIRMDDYTCECPLGTAGANCEREVDFEHIVPSFGGDSFMLFNSKDVARELVCVVKSCWTTPYQRICLSDLKAHEINLPPFRILGNTNKITLRLKVASPTGILLWSGGDHFSAASDYLLLGVKDGHLQLRCVRLQCHVQLVASALHCMLSCQIQLGQRRGPAGVQRLAD